MEPLDVLPSTDERPEECPYSTCDVAGRIPPDLVRHLMDQHGHTWEAAHDLVHETDESGGLNER